MEIEKSHNSKSKPCFKILGKKAFRWHLEIWENQIGNIFRLNIKKRCQIPKRNFVVLGGTRPFKMFGPFWSVWCKMALAKVGMSLP